MQRYIIMDLYINELFVYWRFSAGSFAIYRTECVSEANGLRSKPFAKQTHEVLSLRGSKNTGSTLQIEKLCVYTKHAQWKICVNDLRLLFLQIPFFLFCITNLFCSNKLKFSFYFCFLL